MRNTPLVAVILAAAFVSAISAQNKFEGYNIILNVPTTQRSYACTLRFSPPTTSITITDLDRSSPMKLTPCSGGAASLQQTSATTATIRADASNFKWCFTGEDKRYRISFNGDQYSGPITYNWIATPNERDRGFYNLRDFGAVGDGKTDDTIALKSALAYIASQNGGTLNIPDGDYLITSPVAISSGTKIVGTNGLGSMAGISDYPRNNASRITLSGKNTSLFQIGECVEKVSISDLELNAQSNEGTSGIEAVGAYTSSQNFYFERVQFRNFNRGINAYGLPQTNLNWQFDYVKVIGCQFSLNRDAGIYTNSRNSDWKIQGVVFLNPPKQPGQAADAMRFERAAGVLIEDTFAGGFPNAKGGTFLDILDSGGITLISSQAEAMTNSIVYNGIQNPQAGDYSAAIVVMNSAFSDPIVFNARRTFVSTGNSYGPNTFKADERLRVYSTGDRFCWDGYTLGCQGAVSSNFDKATVVFMTGQPSDGSVKGRPTVFGGTDVEFNSPIRLPSFQQNTLPAGKSDGSLIYCANCRRSTTPCQNGGNGAPAMMVGGQWSCL